MAGRTGPVDGKGEPEVPAEGRPGPPSSPDPAASDEASPRPWLAGHGVVVGLVVLAALYLLLYMPLLTTLPAVYSDDFILMQAADSFARHGTLTFSINSSPFQDPSILGTTETNRAFLEEGYFMAMGLWFKAVGSSITKARLFSCLAGLAYLLVVYLLFVRLAGILPAFTACVLTLLEANFWYTARTVRPDLPTATFCALGLLLATVPPPRSRTASWLLALAAGMAFGVGTTMHPNWTLYIVPAFILLLHRQGIAGDRRRIGAVVLGVALFFVPYAVDLGRNWGEVQKTLHVHSGHTDSLEAVNRAAYTWRQNVLVANVLAEGGRYTGGLGPDHNSGTRHKMLVIEGVAIAWMAIALLVGAVRRRRGLSPLPMRPASRGLVFGFFLAIATALAVTVAYKVPLYLVHIYPWIHLVLALAVLDLGVALGWLVGGAVLAFPVSRPLVAAAVGSVVLTLALAGYTIHTTRTLGALYRGCAQDRVISYEDLTGILARQVPQGSIIFSSPNGWPVADKSGSVLISNQMYPYQQVPLPEFPWKVQLEGSHLRGYAFDASRMEHIARTSGRRVFFMADEFDWAWHGLYPFGEKYGASYSALQGDLAKHFRLVAEVVTRPRGQVRLFEFVPGAGSTGGSAGPGAGSTGGPGAGSTAGPGAGSTAGPALWVEAVRIPDAPHAIFTLDDLRRKVGAQGDVVSLAAIDKPVPLLERTGCRDRLYRVTLRVRARDGAAVFPVFAGVVSTAWRALRLLDSPWPVTYTYYLRSETDRVALALQFVAPKGAVDIEECRVEEW